MFLNSRHEASLYQEAKAGICSLIQQVLPVSLGFVVILLVTGGKPSSWVVGCSFVSGTLFVAWSEQRRITARNNSDLSQSFIKQEHLEQENTDSTQEHLNREQIRSNSLPEESTMRGGATEIVGLAEQHRQFIQDLVLNLQALATVLEQRGYLASCYTTGGQMDSASFMVSLGENHLIRFLVSEYGITWTEMRDNHELMKLEGAQAISQLQELAELVRYKPRATDEPDEINRVFTTLNQLSKEAD